MVPRNLLRNWTTEQVARMHNAIFVAQHRLAELELFSDEGLAHTLDAQPRADLSVGTMGSDPVRRDQWQEGDAGRLSGKTLLETVKNGRLSLTLRQITRNHDDYRVVVNALYDELESLCDCGPIFKRSADLSISSPGTIAYYHVDAPVSMIWQIRGARRVWAYPLEAGILSARMIESIVYGELSEEAGYYPELDRYATVVDLEPGQTITWPQHTPYRFVNVDGLNVSLFTRHMTRSALRKNDVYLANRYLRRFLGCSITSTRLTGFVPATKEMAVRATRRLSSTESGSPQTGRCPITFRVDPTAPNGVRELSTSQGDEAPVVIPSMDAPSVDAPLVT
jgi:hypothetical protein